MLGFKKFPTAVAHLASYLTDLTGPGLTISKIGFGAAATAAVLPFLTFMAGGEPVSAWNWVIPAGLVLLIEGYRLQELAITDEMDRLDANLLAAAADADRHARNPEGT